MRDLSERLCLTGASRESVKDCGFIGSRPSSGLPKGRRFDKRNSMERWFREMKNKTKRFYNNVNSKKLKSMRR